MENEHECARRIKSEYPTLNIEFKQIIPYASYRASDIGCILKITNIRASIVKYDCTEKHYIVCDSESTNNIRKHQNYAYLSHKGLEKLLFSSRSSESMKMNELMGMEVARKWFPCIELDVVTNILSAFRSENVCRQFACDKYRIDLYFIDHKIAVECDELHHRSETNKTKDKMRETVLKQNLHCEFIRFNPFDPQFNVFELIGKIHSAITEKLKMK
jgi:very-short-patch-repair endonuclease